MWTYILRRLLAMIPTLFGVTVVSFVIMQIAPGDPMDNLGSSGLSTASGQSRDAYLIRKRDLKLDKPLLLNFNYFADYADPVRTAAELLGRDTAGVTELLAQLANHPEKAENARRMEFLESLDIDDFRERLNDPEQRPRMAAAIRGGEAQGLMGGGLVRVWCEDAGIHGVPPAIHLLSTGAAAGAPAPDETQNAGQARPLNGLIRIGAIRALGFMVVEPFRYTYTRDPDPEQTPEIQAVWRHWWERAKGDFPELDADRRRRVEQRFDQIAAAKDRRALFTGLDYLDPDELDPFERRDMRVFIERLLDDDSSLRERVVASMGLRLYLGRVLQTELPADVGDMPVDERRTLLSRVADNWLLYYRLNDARYHPGTATKLGAIFTDTQYANMAWRLVTFNFGRSTLKTREPVSQKILDAVLVSAPLMVLAQVVIYLVAVPLGIVCAVNRGNSVDRSISLGLFLLYSIPPFVAAMLFLLLFAYGDWLRLFPMEGLHSTGAEELGPVLYAIDYLWHIILPVVCLSLFSLAGMAMYSRTSMLDVIGQDYIRTARAKGLSEDAVVYKHGLRNSLIPILTLFSNLLPAMLGGSVLIEVIFGIPGMGTLSWASIEQKDFPTLMALIYINAIVVMLSILLTDILYVLVDPRIGFGGRGGAE